MTLGDGEQLSERSETPLEGGDAAAQTRAPAQRFDFRAAGIAAGPARLASRSAGPAALAADLASGSARLAARRAGRAGLASGSARLAAAPPYGWQSGQPPVPPFWPPAPQDWPPAPAGSGLAPTAPTWVTDSSPRRRPSRWRKIVVVFGAILLAFSRRHGRRPPDRHIPQQQQTLQNFDVYQQALQDIRDHFVGRGSLTDQQLLYGSFRAWSIALVTPTTPDS